jgi:outer membrane lipoprotein-sorting protein
MTEKLPNEDALLDAAVQALRKESLGDKLPQEVLARITALGMAPDVDDFSASSLALPRGKKWLGPLLKGPKVSLALRAAVFLVVGGLVGLAAFLRTGTTLAFADVAEQFRDAHTLSFQMTVQSSLMPKLITGKTGNMDLQVVLKEPGRFRAEGPLGFSGVASLGQDQSKLLVLHPLAKIALLVAAKGNLQQLGYLDPMEWVKTLRTLAEKSAQPAGKRLIGEVEAQGFLIKENGDETLVWADPKTRLPILIEGSSPDGTPIAFSDFRFNPELDDALFSLEVPKGYKLVPIDVEVLSPEESLVRMLRSYAETSAGKFPTRLEDASPVDMQGALNFVCATMFADSLKGDCVYSPEGTKLGDADKILFWYRPPQASKSRGLYGDLHWADLTIDQLPKQSLP